MIVARNTTPFNTFAQCAQAVINPPSCVTSSPGASASGGKRPLFRGPRTTLGGFAGAAASIHQLYGPAVRPAVEAEEAEDINREDDDEAGPPNPGRTSR
jgi:hypothetical protein